MRFATFFGVLAFAMLLAGCGRSPAGGQEGEICAADSDCASGHVCSQSVCQFLAGRDAGGQPRTGLFFVVIELEDWTGASTSGQLRQLGQFISDLSTILTPYYGAHAQSETQLVFGLVDTATDPLVLDDDGTTTAMLMRRSGTTYLADQDLLLVPVFYEDANVALAFDMPLSEASIRFQFPSGFQPGEIGAVSFSGALRSDVATELLVEQGGETFTLFDVLRSEPLDADTDFDGTPHAWTMSWIGTAYAL